MSRDQDDGSWVGLRWGVVLGKVCMLLGLEDGGGNVQALYLHWVNSRSHKFKANADVARQIVYIR